MAVLNKSLIALIIGAALAGAYFVSNQESSDRLNAKFQLKTALNALIAIKSKKPYDKPQEAIDYALLQRVAGGKGKVEFSQYRKALKKMEKMQQYSSVLKQVLPSRAEFKASPELRAAFKMADGENEELSAWDNLGPGNIGGRTRTIVINPDDTNIVYTAGVNGGVWRSNDAGANWTPLDDMLPNLAVVTLVMDPDDPDTLYAGTGEGVFDRNVVQGNGIFRTTDGGDTWEQLMSTAANDNFTFVNKLAISANDSNRLYAATRQGIFRTIDAGVTWELVHDGSDVTVGCLDIQIRTDLATDNLVGACGSFLPSRIVRSTDGGDTFTTVLAEAAMGRSTLAIAPSNQDIIYALNATNELITNNIGSLGLNAVYRSNDGGATWQTQYDVDTNTTLSGDLVVPNDTNNAGFTLLSNPLLSILPICGYDWQQFFNQGWYDNIITVDPTNPDVVWAGGVDIARSSDGGQSWGLASVWFLETNAQYAHADNHIFAFSPNYDGEANQSMYVGNDGGIQRTNNAASGRTLTIQEYCAISGGTFVPDDAIISWENLNNNYRVTQFYHGTAYPDGETYFGGTQDNGTLRGNDVDGANQWTEILGGDGGYVAVDPTNTDILFAETIGLSLIRSNDGGVTYDYVTNGITGGGFPFITTFIMDSNNPQRLWIVGDTIWRTDDQADNWVQASTAFSDGSRGTRGSAIANAPSNSERVLVGTEGGLILRNADAGNANDTTVWEQSAPLGGFVSSVAFDPSDENIAYATLSTFGVSHVLRSTDAGVTWAAIDNMGQANGIPDIPAHTIAVDPIDPRRLFVGTDLGVFVSIDSGANWMIENGGFANTQVETLEFSGRHLFAFTHGRSAYRVAVNDLTRVNNSIVAVDEDTALSFVATDFLDSITDSPVPATPVSIEILAFENGSLSNGTEAVVAGDLIAVADLANLSFTSPPNFNGEATITWQAQDAASVVTRSADMTITVNPVNDAPTGNISPLEGSEGRALTQDISGNFSDVDGDELSFTATGLPEGLSINTQGVITGTPANGGEAQVTVTASDGELTGSSTFTFTIIGKDNGSGSFGWAFLIAILGLAGLRRSKN